MAITFRTGTTVGGTYGTGVTLALPTGTVSTDIVVVAVGLGTTTLPAFTASGFTTQFEDMDNANNVTGLTVMTANGYTAPGNITISSSTLASGDGIAGVAVAVVGADINNMVLGALYSQGPGGGDFLIPGVTTTVANSEVLVLGSQAFAGTARTTTPANTERGAIDATVIASIPYASAGATGTVTVTNTNFSSAIFALLAMQELAVADVPWLSRRRRHAPLVTR